MPTRGRAGAASRSRSPPEPAQRRERRSRRLGSSTFALRHHPVDDRPSRRGRRHRPRDAAGLEPRCRSPVDVHLRRTAAEAQRSSDIRPSRSASSTESRFRALNSSIARAPVGLPGRRGARTPSPQRGIDVLSAGLPSAPRHRYGRLACLSGTPVSGPCPEPAAIAARILSAGPSFVSPQPRLPRSSAHPRRGSPCARGLLSLAAAVQRDGEEARVLQFVGVVAGLVGSTARRRGTRSVAGHRRRSRARRGASGNAGSVIWLAALELSRSPRRA